MNYIVLTGRLVKDTEVRRTSEGTAIARNTIAVDDGYGEKKRTNFINIVAFGKTADNMEMYSFKGQKLALEGKIQTGSYEKDGQKVYTTDVIINRLEYIDWKDGKSEAKTIEKQTGFTALDEDIPF